MSKRSRAEAHELTYPLGAASRLTGLSPELLRAWERRYGVVEPVRTPGGTRRYRAADLERLRLVKAAVDAGHRIGQVAGLDLDELRERACPPPTAVGEVLAPILSAIASLDADETRRLLGLQLAALGPVPFARDVATPLLQEIGERWARDEIGVAAEHLATSVIRSQLGATLQPTAASLRGPRIVFTTPEGERHEIGLQMAALVALGAGASPLYLGLEMPVEECVAAVERSDAAALGISVVTLPPARALGAIHLLRDRLPDDVRIWVGGHGAPGLALPDGVERITDLERLEQEVSLLAIGRKTS